MNSRNLINLRNRAGLTGVALATKAGIAQNQVSRLESGLRRGNSDTLRAIADALAAELELGVGDVLKALTDPA